MKLFIAGIFIYVSLFGLLLYCNKLSNSEPIKTASILDEDWCGLQPPYPGGSEELAGCDWVCVCAEDRDGIRKCHWVLGC